MIPPIDDPAYREILTCRCCGLFAGPRPDPDISDELVRCLKHTGRNPCAIEGCERTTAVKGIGYASDQWLCGEHWRMGVPPRSPMRRAYQRFWRLAKRRGGWDAVLRRRFFRFWDALVKRARRRCAGDIDMREIEEMFGWDEAATP